MSFYINGLNTKTGQELVKTLSGYDTRLFLSDINKEVLEKLKEKISEKNCEPYFLQVDIRDPYQVEGVINKAFKSLKTIDCAINNFSLHTIPTNIIDCSVDYLVRTCMSSLSSVFTLMKYELSLLLGLQSKSTIINIFSSNREIDFVNSHATAAYLHAIKGLTLATSNSYANNGIVIKSFYVQYGNRSVNKDPDWNNCYITDLAGPLENVINQSISARVFETLLGAQADN